MLPDFRYVRPASVKEAVEELASPDTCLHAGGTDLLGCLRDGVFSARKLVALGGIAELRRIEPSGGGLRIGALASIADVANHRNIRESYTALAQAAHSVGSPQLRNQGTLGGNICQRPRCWYFRSDFRCLRKGGDNCYAPGGENEYHAIFGGEGCFMVHPSDTAAALGALEARLRIVGPKGSRTIAAEAFFIRPSQDVLKENVLEAGEVVTEILLPPAANIRSSYRKVRVRASFDFALAGVALALRGSATRVESARIFLSGVAAVPWRAREAERALTGKRIDAQVANSVAALAVAGAQPLSQNAYKVDLVRGIVEESLAALA